MSVAVTLAILYFIFIYRPSSDSTTWQMTSYTGSRSPDIALTSDENPCVTWDRSNDIYLRCWNGQDWIELGGSASGGGISNDTSRSIFSAIAIDRNDNIYVAWTNQESGNDRIYIKYWNGEQWGELGEGSATGIGISEIDGASAPDLAITSDGIVFVVWGHRFEGPIYAKQWDGLVWNDVGNNSSSQLGISGLEGESAWPIITLDQADRPYVAWAHRLNNEHTFFVTMFDGQHWQTLGEDSISPTATSKTKGHALIPEMDISIDGTPYLVWDSEGQTFVSYWDGNQWQPINQPEIRIPLSRRFSNYSIGATNLVADLQGGFFLTFEGSIESKYYDVYILQFNDGKWSLVDQDSTPNLSASDPNNTKLGGHSWSADIAVNQANVPIVAWEDQRNGFPEIFVSYWNGKEWVLIGNGGDAGRYEENP